MSRLATQKWWPCSTGGEWRRMYVASLFAREPFALAPVSSLSRVSHCTLPGASVIRRFARAASGVRHEDFERLGAFRIRKVVSKSTYIRKIDLLYTLRRGAHVSTSSPSPRRRRRGAALRMYSDTDLSRLRVRRQPLGGPGPGRRAPRGSPDATRSRRASRDRSRGARTGHRRGDARPRERRAGEPDAPTRHRAPRGARRSGRHRTPSRKCMLSSSVLAGRSFSLPGPPPPSSPGAPMSHWRGMSPSSQPLRSEVSLCLCLWRPTR